MGKLHLDDGAEEEVLDAGGLDGVLETAAILRRELNEDHWADYRDQQKLFQFLFNVKGDKLKLLNDLIYYQGGYPSPTSPPKAESIGKRFAEGYRLLWLVGRQQDMNQHLEPFGLKVVVTDPSKLELPLVSKKIPRLLVDYCAREEREVPSKWETRVVLKWFISYCCDLQATICGKANIIKKQLYPEAKKQAGDLTKGDFRETVGLRYRNTLVNEPLRLDQERKTLTGMKTIKQVEKRKANLAKRLKTNKKRVKGFQFGMRVAVKKEEEEA